MSIAGKRTVKRGAEYYAYLRSDAWYEVKLRYLQSKLPKNCYICAAPWSNAFVFHHRTYKNLGCERLMDIVPVCRPCHDIVHASANPAPIAMASDQPAPEARNQERSRCDSHQDSTAH